MNTTRTCPECGKPVAPNGLQGLCPECMMKVGLATQTGEAGPGGRPVVPPQAKPPPTLAKVASLFPQLEILECLGCGGMGAVYKARQPRLDRLVALKILTCDRQDATRDARFAERFEREARALAKLSHPNIVAIYEFGQAGGMPYFIMEHVEGLNLRRLEQTGKLAPREALQIIPQICEALQFAHDEGIVHRDIKPENILLDKKGRVKIADFGIAKILGGTSLIESDAEKLAIKPGEGLTQDQILGTPHYMAPEQVEHPRTVDHRADIYSLGVVFYEMLTGELPVGKFQPPSRKVRIDVRLDEIVLHTLEKEPERRYQHASEVRTDVENVTSTPPHPEGMATESRRRSRAGLGLTGILVGTRDGMRAIHWTGVFREWLIISALAGLGFFVISQLTSLRLGILESCIAMLFPAVMWVGAWVLRGWSAPRDKLVSLETPTAGTVTGSGGKSKNARSCRIPGTNLALVESRNGQRLVNWTNVSLAWVLLMLVGAAGLGLVEVIANQMGFYFKPETFPTAGLVMAFVAGFVLSVAVRQALLWPDDEFESLAPSAKAASETLDLERVKNARRLVRWPATGLMAIGLCFPTVVGCFFAFGQWQADWKGALALFPVLFINYVIILGSWRMRRLKSYRLAVLAAIVSLVIGLPLAVFPIWALMVLYRPDVRAAFNDVARKGYPEPAAPPASTSSVSVPRVGTAWKILAGVAAVSLLVIVVALLAVYGPSQARQQQVSAGAVVRVQEKLRREIQQRLAEGGWKVESLNVSVSPDLKRAECRLENNLKKMTGENLFEYVSGTLNIRHRGGGLWEVEGQGQLWLVHFTVDASAEMSVEPGAAAAAPPLRLSKQEDAEPADVQAALAATFGPDTEITLNDMDDLRGGEALDLDSGRLLDLPKDTGKRSESEQFQWIKEHSADVLLDNVNGRWGLLTSTDNKLKLAPLPNEKWEVATERDLSQALTAEPSGLEIKQHGTWTVYILPTNAPPPLTFGFRTANGASGLLQITRFGEEPNSARIRFKLMHEGKHEASKSPELILREKASQEVLGRWKMLVDWAPAPDVLVNSEPDRPVLVTPYGNTLNQQYSIPLCI